MFPEGSSSQPSVGSPLKRPRGAGHVPGSAAGHQGSCFCGQRPPWPWTSILVPLAEGCCLPWDTRAANFLQFWGEASQPPPPLLSVCPLRGMQDPGLRRVGCGTAHAHMLAHSLRGPDRIVPWSRRPMGALPCPHCALPKKACAPQGQSCDAVFPPAISGGGRAPRSSPPARGQAWRVARPRPVAPPPSAWPCTGLWCGSWHSCSGCPWVPLNTTGPLVASAQSQAAGGTVHLPKTVLSPVGEFVLPTPPSP